MQLMQISRHCMRCVNYRTSAQMFLVVQVWQGDIQQARTVTVITLTTSALSRCSKIELEPGVLSALLCHFVKTGVLKRALRRMSLCAASGACTYQAGHDNSAQAATRMQNCAMQAL